MKKLLLALLLSLSISPAMASDMDVESLVPIKIAINPIKTSKNLLRFGSQVIKHPKKFVKVVAYETKQLIAVDKMMLAPLKDSLEFYLVSPILFGADVVNLMNR
jgi:hypothetical protein